MVKVSSYYQSSYTPTEKKNSKILMFKDLSLYIDTKQLLFHIIYNFFIKYADSH